MEKDCYLVDRVCFNLEERKIFGDMAWSFDEAIPLPMSDYVNDEELISTIKNNFDNIGEYDNGISIFYFFKTDEFESEMDLFCTLAMCTKERASELGIEADSFID